MRTRVHMQIDTLAPISSGHGLLKYHLLRFNLKLSVCGNKFTIYYDRI